MAMNYLKNFSHCHCNKYMQNIIKLQHHKPVMLQEAISALNIKPDGVYVDGTFGRGGHAQAILNQLSSRGKLLILDVDPVAILAAKNLSLLDKRVTVFHDSFANIKKICAQSQISYLDGVLLDLGVSSPQLDDANRGFSFTKDGPLDMRMDNTKGEPAYKWLATVSKSDLILVLKEYGQERFAKKIADNIILARNIKPITTTLALAEVIKNSCPASYCKFKHPATRTFQAIRIFINKELLNLQQALPQYLDLLSIQGRLVVISFHSLEDTIVKYFINKYAKNLFDNYATRKFPINFINNNEVNIRLKKINRLKPNTQEIKDNVRARSAIMRVAEKCA